MAKTQRRARSQPPRFQPDLESATILQNALQQASVLPLPDQWPMTLELLPDELLWKVARAAGNTEPNEDIMDLYGPLAMAASQYYMDMEADQTPDDKILMAAVYGVVISFIAELERRQHHFSADVIHMDNPIGFDGEHPITLIPKNEGDPLVDLNEVLTFYQTSKPA